MEFKKFPCIYFNQEGGCRNGDACKFRHEINENLSKKIKCAEPNCKRMARANSDICVICYKVSQGELPNDEEYRLQKKKYRETSKFYRRDNAVKQVIVKTDHPTETSGTWSDAVEDEETVMVPKKLIVKCCDGEATAIYVVCNDCKDKKGFYPLEPAGGI